MRIIQGDNIVVLKTLEENSVDSIVTDPPYGLHFMNKKWDYDVPTVEFWREALRVLKPGGHILSFGGTRTYHRMVVNVEDAGFEIRDTISWNYGCLSYDTEILTKDGWLGIDRISFMAETSVLNYDIGNNTFFFDKPKNTFYYENEHTAIRIHNDYTDQILSRNHRVIVERDGIKTFQEAATLQQQENIPIQESLWDLPETIYDIYERTSHTKQDLLKRVLRTNDKDQQNNTNWSKSGESRSKLRLLWGGYVKKSKRIERYKTLLWLFLSGKSKSDRQKMVLQREGKVENWNWTERRQEPCLEGWCLFREKARATYRRGLDKVSRRLKGNGEKKWLYSTTQSSYGKSVGEIIKESGGSSSYRSQPVEQQYKKSNSIFKQQNTQNIRGTRAKIEEVEYKDGRFWCVETTSGAFIARRNGKIFLTGNSGFPKSHNISKAIDRLKGAEREVIGEGKSGSTSRAYQSEETTTSGQYNLTSPATEEAKTWEGWGTALKPAVEKILLAQKPYSLELLEQELIQVIKKELWKLYVKIVENHLLSNYQDIKGGLNTALWNVEKNTNIEEDLSDLTDMLHFGLEMNINLNIVLLWKNILEEILQNMNKFIILMKSNLIIDLKTLLSLEWGSILESIINANNNQISGGHINVSIVEAIFQGLKAKLNYTHTPSAQEIVSLRVETEIIEGSVSEELIVLARKPLSEKTIAENVLKYGTGGLNIDKCRIGIEKISTHNAPKGTFAGGELGRGSDTSSYTEHEGRFPANVIFDEEAGKILDEQAGERTSGARKAHHNVGKAGKDGKMVNHGVYGEYNSRPYQSESEKEKGGTSRFFYCPKVSSRERNEGLDDFELKIPIGRDPGQDNRNVPNKPTPTPRRNTHTTVKPIKLMSYLINLITPVGGIVLDPFMGSGSTGVACVKEGFDFIGIELEQEYVDIAQARIDYAVKNNTK